MIRKETLKKYKDMAEYLKEGHTYRETAIKFDCKMSYISNAMIRYKKYLKEAEANSTNSLFAFLKDNTKLYKCARNFGITNLDDLVTLFKYRRCLLPEVKGLGKVHKKYFEDKLIQAGYITEDDIKINITHKYYRRLSVPAEYTVKHFTNILAAPNEVVSLDKFHEITKAAIKLNPECIKYIDVNYLTPDILKLIENKYKKYINKNIKKCIEFEMHYNSDEYSTHLFYVTNY